MACVEKTALWGYAAGELEADMKARLDEHLAGCESCRAELEAVQATREVLSFAAPLAPQVDWRRADAQVHDSVEKRFMRAERGWGWLVAGLAGAGALAMVLAVLAINRQSKAIDPAALAMLDALPTPSAVESADGALVTMDGAEHLVKPGEDLRAGAQVKTTSSGKAVFQLPEGSRVRVASASDVVLKKAAKDEVGLVLKSGRVAVTATHAARKAFLIEADGATVRVVGTAFSVGLSEGSIDVAVAEGRVLVELADGQVKPVSAGERLSMDRSKPIELDDLKPASLTTSDRTELAELGVQVALAEAPKPLRPIAAPRPPVVVAAAPVPAPVPEPAAAPAAVPASANEWASAPMQPSAPRESVLHPRRKPEALRPISPLDQMMDEADFAAKNGHCHDWINRFTSDLEDNTDDLNFRERALIYIARCYKAMDDGAKADVAYRKYLGEFGHAAHSDEARKAIAH